MHLEKKCFFVVQYTQKESAIQLYSVMNKNQPKIKAEIIFLILFDPWIANKLTVITSLNWLNGSINSHDTPLWQFILHIFKMLKTTTKIQIAHKCFLSLV